MPAALDVDKEQVRMLVLSVGVTEASRQTGIDLSTVKQWSARGKWLAHARPENRPQLPLSMQPRVVTNVTKPADALEKLLVEGAKNTRIGLTRYTERMAKEASEAGTLEEAPLLKAVADIHAKMHPEQQDAAQAMLAFFSITGASQVHESPTYDLPSAEPDPLDDPMF